MRMDNVTISDLYCEKCGFHTTVPRSRSRKRNFGHMKKLWCPFCKEEINFREVRDGDFSLDHVERKCM